MASRLLFIILSIKLIAANSFLGYFKQHAIVPQVFLDTAVNLSRFTLDSMVEGQALEECAKRCILKTASCFYFYVEEENGQFYCNITGAANALKNPPVAIQEVKSVVIYKMSEDPATTNAYFRVNMAEKSTTDLASFLAMRYSRTYNYFSTRFNQRDTVRAQKYGMPPDFSKIVMSIISFWLDGTKDAILHARIPQVANFEEFTANSIKLMPLSQTEIEKRKGLLFEASQNNLLRRQPFMLDFIQIFFQSQKGWNTVYDPERSVLFIYGDEKPAPFLIKAASNDNFIIVQSSSSPSSSYFPSNKDGEVEMAINQFVELMQKIGIFDEQSQVETMTCGPSGFVKDLLPQMIADPSRDSGVRQKGLLTAARLLSDLVSELMKAVLYKSYNDRTEILRSKLFQSTNKFSDLVVLS